MGNVFFHLIAEKILSLLHSQYSLHTKFYMCIILKVIFSEYPSHNNGTWKGTQCKRKSWSKGTNSALKSGVSTYGRMVDLISWATTSASNSRILVFPSRFFIWYITSHSYIQNVLRHGQDDDIPPKQPWFISQSSLAAFWTIITGKSISWFPSLLSHSPLRVPSRELRPLWQPNKGTAYNWNCNVLATSVIGHRLCLLLKMYESLYTSSKTFYFCIYSY